MLGESKKEYRQGTVLEVKKDGVWQELKLSNARIRVKEPS